MKLDRSITFKVKIGVKFIDSIKQVEIMDFFLWKREAMYDFYANFILSLSNNLYSG